MQHNLVEGKDNTSPFSCCHCGLEKVTFHRYSPLLVHVRIKRPVDGLYMMMITLRVRLKWVPLNHTQFGLRFTEVSIKWLAMWNVYSLWMKNYTRHGLKRLLLQINVSLRGSFSDIGDLENILPRIFFSNFRFLCRALPLK